MFVSFRRITRLGWQQFSRERVASSAALVTMVIVLTLLSSVLFLRGFNEFLVASLQDRISIGAYFTDTATEEEIIEIREDVVSRAEVKEVEYVPADVALEEFLAKHEDDEYIIDAVSAVGGNPLSSSLNIKVWDPETFEQVVRYLENAKYAPLIAEVDFQDRAPVIERATNMIDGVRTVVFAIIGLGVLIAILVTFNTTRLAIYNSKEEIGVMRLVGASNWFIRGPFLIQGIVIGVIATLVTTIILAIAIFLLSSRIESFTESLNQGGFNLWNYFTSNLFTFILLQFAVGCLLGVITSFAAIRKYLSI